MDGTGTRTRFRARPKAGLLPVAVPLLLSAALLACGGAADERGAAGDRITFPEEPSCPEQ